MAPAHILVPVDFQPASQAALRYALAMAAESHAEVDVLHVVPPPRALDLVLDAYLGRKMPLVSPDVVSRAEHNLEETLARTPHPGVEVHRRIEAGDPAATIVRLAVEDGHDLIVMGTHAHSTLRDLVLGSVAQRVITCAPCPVLTMRGDGGDATAGESPV
jgi:nucleotide-binding universal stress UspA family protein